MTTDFPTFADGCVGEHDPDGRDNCSGRLNPDWSAEPDKMARAEARRRATPLPVGDHVDKVIADLLETDALTVRRESSDGVYYFHEDDLEHLVRNVIDIDREVSDAEHTYTWGDAANDLAVSSPLTFLEALDLVYPLNGIVAPGDAVRLLIAGVTSQGRDGHSLAALLQAAVMHSRPDPKVMIDPEAAGAVCHSDLVVGECSWLWCPQTRDGGPTDRHCPLDRTGGGPS